MVNADKAAGAELRTTTKIKNGPLREINVRIAVVSATVYGPSNLSGKSLMFLSPKESRDEQHANGIASWNSEEQVGRLSSCSTEIRPNIIRGRLKCWKICTYWG